MAQKTQPFPINLQSNIQEYMQKFDSSIQKELKDILEDQINITIQNIQTGIAKYNDIDKNLPDSDSDSDKFKTILIEKTKVLLDIIINSQTLIKQINNFTEVANTKNKNLVEKLKELNNKLDTVRTKIISTINDINMLNPSATNVDSYKTEIENYKTEIEGV